MPTSQSSGSPAFQAGIEQQIRFDENYAKRLRKNLTDESQLLDEESARKLRKFRIDAFSGKVWAAIERQNKGVSNLSKMQEAILQRVTCISSRRPKKETFSCLASNHLARNIFFDGVYQVLQPVCADCDVKMYFATIVDKDWCLPKDAKSFDVKSMMLRAKRALRDIGWHGVLFLEIQAVSSLKEAKFLAHLHGFVWRRKGSGLGPRKATTLLNKRLEGIKKAKGIVLKLVEPNALPNRFFYATKLPDTAKTYQQGAESGHAFDQPKSGKLRKAAEKNYTGLDALRIVRLLGQHEIDKVAFAVGEGTQVRKAGSKKLTEAALKITGLQADPSANSVVRVLSKLLRD